MDKNKDLNKNTEYTSKDKYLLNDDLLDAVSGGVTAGKNTGGDNPIFRTPKK